MKTTKQIADGLRVSKQQVYRYIKKHCINEALQENGVKYYDETAESLIAQGFSQNTASSEVLQKHINEAPTETAIEAVISMLQKELDAKNKQIADQAELLKAKDKQIENLTSSIDNLTTSLQAEQALHGGTMKQLVAPEEVSEPADVVIDVEPEQKKRGFFSLFKKIRSNQ